MNPDSGGERERGRDIFLDIQQPEDKSPRKTPANLGEFLTDGSTSKQANPREKKKEKKKFCDLALWNAEGFSAGDK